MKTIKIWFTDFYEGFNPHNNYFSEIIEDLFTLEISEYDPDYLIYSCYGNDFLNFNCVKIYYTGENLVPDFNLCDYAIGFHYINFGERYLRVPNFVFFQEQFQKLLDLKKSESNLFQKEHFCNFIYANSKANPKRDEFFRLLSEYKTVASPGSHLNNINFDVGERYSSDWMFTKIDFQAKCKFSIAFENSMANGYTTEKIMHAFISNTIPIYWGNPEVEKDFNSEAFINCHNFDNFEDVVRRVKEIDQDDQLYKSILEQPAFIENEIPEHLDPKNLTVFLKSIFEKEPEAARQRPNHGTTIKYENDILSLIKLKKKLKPILKFLK